jgi:ketosteroid isomerase-like protein
MKRLGSAISIAILFVAADPAGAQQLSEAAGVKAADEAFYAALSARNIAAMQKVWSHDPDTQNIGPRSKTVAVGWNTIAKGYEATFDAFPELQVSVEEPRIKIVGDIAWVSGIEKAKRKNKAGETSSGSNMGTSIFQKQDGRWLMVYHHASPMPQ